MGTSFSRPHAANVFHHSPFPNLPLLPEETTTKNKVEVSSRTRCLDLWQIGNTRQYSLHVKGFACCDYPNRTNQCDVLRNTTLTDDVEHTGQLIEEPMTDAPPRKDSDHMEHG